MEAHKILEKKDFDVKSYGTGNHVKVPGALLLVYFSLQYGPIEHKR
jgi:hypothetical protein